MDFDESVAMQDEGISAYAGHHIEGGELGAFLRLCETGEIPQGSVLVVEAVDRLTRLDHLDAVSLFSRLLKWVDVHIVQLGRTFTNEVVRHDMGALFTLIGAIALGHQESRQKSDRVGHAWEQKRKRAKADGSKLTSMAPAWLKPDENGFTPIPDRVAVVRQIFESFVAGISQDAITRELNQSKTPVFGRSKHWNRSYVKKILTNEAVLGVLAMGRKRKCDRTRTIVETVPGYFPVIIEESLFTEASRQIKSGTKGRAPTQNPVQGIFRCPHCGGMITRQNKGDRSLPKLVCSNVRLGAGKEECGKIRVDLKQFWNDFRVEQIRVADKNAARFGKDTMAALSKARKDASEARQDLETVRDATATLREPSVDLVTKVARMESKVADLEANVRNLTRESNVGWNHLKEILECDEASPAEISARLKSVYPNGLIFECQASVKAA